MKREVHTDVLVVGAGPVGMFTGLRLVQAGLDVMVIDRAPGPATRSYACALHPRSIELLVQQCNLPNLQSSARQIDGVAVYAGKERAASLSLGSLSAAFPYALALPQSALESMLSDRLSAAGCAVQWNHQLSTLHPGESSVIAQVDQLAGLPAGQNAPRWDQAVEASTTIAARFVVGADGRHSLVRRLLGIDVEEAAESEYYVSYEFETDAALPDELAVVIDRGAASALWPLPGGRGRWSFQVPLIQEAAELVGKERRGVRGESADANGRTLEQFKERLAGRVPWFNANVKAVRWAVEIQFQHRLAHQFGRASCWLVGDAAHQTSPAGCQSMNVGLLEAEELVRLLTGVLRDGAPPRDLDGYDQMFQQEWRQLLGFGEPPIAAPAASPWAKDHGNRLVRSLPASRAELIALLAQLGLSFPEAGE